MLSSSVGFGGVPRLTSVLDSPTWTTPDYIQRSREQSKPRSMIKIVDHQLVSERKY